MTAATPAATAGAGGDTVAVAFSGGPDSLALLHATCRSAQALGLRVLALHIHHNLLPEADAWLAQAQAMCTRWVRRGWPLRLRWARLDGVPAKGQSTEAWARAGRYAALTRLALEEGATLVLLAQHRLDQAETVLLQALRGAGPAGLSAMPRNAVRDGITWVRPWLDQPRETIEAYLRRHRLRPVQDPTNADPAYARGRMRLALWPALTTAFVDAETALAAVARRAQEADAALAELAAMDLARLRDGSVLRLPAWLALSAARRAVSLRAWLAEQPGVVPSETLVQRLLADLPGRSTGQWPAGPGWVCRLYRQRLRCLPVFSGAQPTVGLAGAPTNAVQPAAMPLDLSQPGRYAVPGWTGDVEVVPVEQGGAEPALLRHLTARPRRGGERLALTPAGMPRSLKKQYQARGVPETDRAGPLLWSGEQLVFVPGLGIDGRCQAAPGAAQLALCWQVAAASTAPAPAAAESPAPPTHAPQPGARR